MDRETFGFELSSALKPLKGHDTSKYNKAVHAAGNVLWPKIRRWKDAEVRGALDKQREANKELEKALPEEHITDEEASVRFLNHLKQKAASGEFDAALAGKIMDAFNIKQKDRDIMLKIVDFKDVYPEDADVIALTATLIEKQIEQANQ